MKTYGFRRIFLYGLIGTISLNSAEAFDPAAHFEKACSGCHTIGAGALVGPDLKGVSELRSMEWIVSFIRSPQKMIKGGDPVAKELFDKYNNVTMPDQDLTPDEIKQLMEFIKSGGVATASGEGKPATSATETDVIQGRDLYLGRIPFANGGPACVACHSVAEYGPLGGGTLALNLTQVYSKYGDQALSQSLLKPGFRIMKEIFAEKLLTPDEIFALKAFLYDADKKGDVAGDYQKKFLFLGVGGTVLMLGITDWIWRKRRKKSAKPWMK